MFDSGKKKKCICVHVWVTCSAQIQENVFDIMSILLRSGGIKVVQIIIGT